ncbi:hypothetical protein NIES2098_22840 [Calothrix sp. NIES-2098]|nr:hypothetical protein NIES2098_22840 [Calothrix sp. NIES-2098]
MLELFTCQGSGDFREPPGIFAPTLVREKFGLANNHKILIDLCRCVSTFTSS